VSSARRGARITSVLERPLTRQPGRALAAHAPGRAP